MDRAEAAPDLPKPEQHARPQRGADDIVPSRHDSPVTHVVAIRNSHNVCYHTGVASEGQARLTFVRELAYKLL